MDELIALVATTDGARARAFYEGVLEQRFVEDTPYALVFEVGGIMLRIQKVQELSPHPFTALGWKVASIAETVKKLTARGVSFERYSFLTQDEHGIWSAPDGNQVAWFKDPDGNTLSLSEFSTR